MPRLSRDWERRAQSRRATELLLAQPDIAELSEQLELALFYDDENRYKFHYRVDMRDDAITEHLAGASP